MNATTWPILAIERMVRASVGPEAQSGTTAKSELNKNKIFIQKSVLISKYLLLHSYISQENMNLVCVQLQVRQGS